ncbi:hypothetical protein DFH09DRAFT_1083222 [Mycena vulgaris]|nr:hypothetical protein DFH09DRAFT_1083222 [Mycena vulgaris]
MPFFKYTLPLASASQRSSGQRCTRLFHSPRYELRARRRHACAHGLLFTAAISIYDLRAQSEAQTHGYYHTADRLVIIGLVGGLDYKNPCWEPYREVPDAFIRSFTHDSALCSQCRCGMPRVRGAHAHRGRAVEALGVPLPRRCNDRALSRRGQHRQDQRTHNEMRLSRGSFGSGFLPGGRAWLGVSVYGSYTSAFLITDPFLPPPKAPSPRSTPPPRSPPPHRLPRSSNAASSASSSASPCASHVTAPNASDHSASSSASKSADRRSSEAKTISLPAYSAAFPAHMRTRTSGPCATCARVRHAPRACRGHSLRRGEHDAPGAGAVEFGTQWEGPDSIDDLGRRAGHAPGGGV